MEKHPNINEFVRILKREDFSKSISCSWRKEAQVALFTEFPDQMNLRFLNLLKEIYPNGLFIHQFQAINAIRKGKNVIITTGPSSGKSLCYQLPILDSLLDNVINTSLNLFPTKALTADQQKKYTELLDRNLFQEKKFSAATYDGDTPSSKRIAIRNTVSILLTNPDMLHLGILPFHTRWERFFSNLKYIVIDEAHTYRGVFGSHFANVIRRLKRISCFYGSNLQFILTSATLSNARQLAHDLTGETFQVFEKDASFQEERTYYFINPPVIDKKFGVRRGSIDQSVEVASWMNSLNIQSIIFSKTRRSVEILLKRLRQAISGYSKETHGYRSGYLPQERRLIENGLRLGVIQTVIATNALEMGIDMGKVDAVLMMGYPGSISSFFQQAGRAGRKGRNSITLMIASSSPIDQYIVRHPEYIKSGKPESVLIDPDNPLILLEHLKCAAFELPFFDADEFGNLQTSTLREYLQILSHLKYIVGKQGKYYWISNENPSQDISLRNIPGSPVQLRIEKRLDSPIIGEVDFQSATRLAHPGAVYLHNGKSYLVEKLDLEKNVAWLSEHQENFITEPITDTEIILGSLIKRKNYPNFELYLGELTITQIINGYKQIDWNSSLPIGRFELENLPPLVLNTKGLIICLATEFINDLRSKKLWDIDSNDYGKGWGKLRLSILKRDNYRCQMCNVILESKDLHVHHITPYRSFQNPESANIPENLVSLCPSCHRRAEQSLQMRSGLSGLAYLIGNMSPLFLLCDIHDIGFISDPQSKICENQPVIIIYDQFPGGIGLSARLYDFFPEVLEKCLDVLLACPCENGCPSCVGPAGEDGQGGKGPAREILNRLIVKNIFDE